MAWLELVSIVPFSRLIILYVSLLSKCEVSLTDLNNSKGRFELCKYITQTHTHTHTHGLYLLSGSSLGNTVPASWSLRLSFLKPVIGIFVKTDLLATSGVSKKCNSAKICLAF